MKLTKKKIKNNEITKTVNTVKKMFDKDALHYLLIIYEDDNGKEKILKFTQHLETNQVESVIGILERVKGLFINSINRGMPNLKKLSKKKGKRRKA